MHKFPVVASVELDRIDLGILRALQAEARLSYRDLARRVGVSVPTVSAHVAKLEELGIIRGYHAAIDPARLRLVTVLLVIRVRKGQAGAVGGALSAMPQVRRVAYSKGLRIVAEASVSNTAAVERLVGEVRSLRGVTSCERFVLTERLKDAPPRVPSNGTAVRIPCFECGRDIEGSAVRRTLDGRRHYFCCPSCERLYVERYARIRAAAG